MLINLNRKLLLIPLLVLLVLHCTMGIAAEGATSGRTDTHGEAVPVTSHAESPGLFDFDLSILISQTINFFILLFILKKFLFVPLGEVVEERRRHLGRIKMAAEEEHRIALSLKEVYEGHLARIEDEIYEIKQQAILEANHEKEEIIEEARKKSEEIIEQGEMEIFMERQTAWARIREEVVQLTLMAAEKVVEESLDDEMHHKLIQNTIERLEQDLPDKLA
ncbi:MAG: ATP synthase F0 subunit B [Candidatus Riflebacteria bacterium HGW-Riflebacteria-1]|jgi:F-type H+-transporting ATPase subunit b|nr:MAG: ATP synthase F0 subunit B [Candidatus Riflebacteria bacterium HGW-Riflebacteria-1]